MMTLHKYGNPETVFITVLRTRKSRCRKKTARFGVLCLGPGFYRPLKNVLYLNYRKHSSLNVLSSIFSSQCSNWNLGFWGAMY